MPLQTDQLPDPLEDPLHEMLLVGSVTLSAAKYLLSGKGSCSLEVVVEHLLAFDLGLAVEWDQLEAHLGADQSEQ